MIMLPTYILLLNSTSCRSLPESSKRLDTIHRTVSFLVLLNQDWKVAIISWIIVRVAYSSFTEPQQKLYSTDFTNWMFRIRGHTHDGVSQIIRTTNSECSTSVKEDKAYKMVTPQTPTLEASGSVQTRLLWMSTSQKTT